ncbi:MAG: hypothetical protein ACK5EU_00555 [Pseudanabaena sp.]|nr:hypothetical protein [Pseudanabaena sp. M53BS1SP1A06MG]MCA6584008.1 hypothetical protein [Pseudanabaena sp. M34BS1SP1A06MG]MCA6588698.1 hypothetical protein [Pseudanabaena sp. M109S1SP1A06QC]MCA6593308.1 hypothetical protein [Pseudanabaena sp. M38BS1SP1A06MG]MCA6602155.1 hypothetical protein [Pseudanabaena sp. M57BS1SP1A06MG]MCA6611931.1 hypothetical protein [Pseudanabaena sp. M158S2SP1A06QC]MCA6615368.1 hypothetical protein [Pseudanabaena sp. M090S1SP1A06QC]MCA6624844.1 hypothetical prot
MKSSRLFFSSLVASFSLTIVCSLNASAQSSSDWVDQALGNYQSRILSAGSLVSGTTEFRKTREDSLEGSYTMDEQGKVVFGTLSQCQVMQVLVMRCVWNDKYGTGNLEVTFSENFSSFNGYWGEIGSEPVFRWSGSR